MMSREMKDSGIEWIGEIPREWEVAKMKNIANIVRGGSPRPIEEYITDSDKGYNWIKIGDTQKGYKYITQTKSKIKESGLTKTRLVHINDLILTNSMSFGEPYILKIDGCIHDGWVAFSNYQKVDKEFLYYCLISPFCKIQFEQNVDGGVVQNLNVEKIGSSILLLPSITEQQKIANHLDTKCAEIDHLISLQEEMISELKAYKQSVITETVCKGLNKNVPMKESGIEWIGEIPEHWKTTKIKNIARTNSGSTPKSIKGGDNANIIWIRTTDIWDDRVFDSSEYISKEEFSSASCPMLPPKTLLVAMYGGGGTIGKCGITEVEATINQALCSMECNNSFHSLFLFHVLRSLRYYWMKYAVGTRKDPNINQDIVRRMNIPFPPLPEQQAIADYLDRKCTQIDALISIKQQKAEELKEYKKSMIYEYVTGKKEVI